MVTFWSGIAGHGPDGPLLFCTCAGIRGPDGRNVYQRVWGWADIAAARAGHQAVTAWVTEMAAFLAGRASVLPPPNPVLPAVPPARRSEAGSRTWSPSPGGPPAQGGELRHRPPRTGRPEGQSRSDSRPGPR